MNSVKIVDLRKNTTIYIVGYRETHLELQVDQKLGQKMLHELWDKIVLLEYVAAKHSFPPVPLWVGTQ